jgi:SAM-dependent methyltransferase
MSSPTIDIIIPTWNNPGYFHPCMQSILATGVLEGLARVIVVNNGDQKLAEELGAIKNVLVLDAPRNEMGEKENLGWEGGLKLGLQHSTAPFVVFQNDDTFIPKSSYLIYQRMLSHFVDESVAAVGPSSTVVMGSQCTFNPGNPRNVASVPFLIFFTVMIRRSDLDAVGGVDDRLPGGDDIDLSIRLRQAGKKLLVDPFSFLIHHGFKTGERVHGADWNSAQMTERTNTALIKKHGLKPFWETMFMGQSELMNQYTANDVEGEICKEFMGPITNDEKIVELGCGGNKMVPFSTGIDRVPCGTKIPHVEQVSVADIVTDVQERIPLEDEYADIVIARHILEHCIDPIKTVRYWNRILKTGGKLILAVPDEGLIKGIPTNPEHVHAFTQDSLKSVMSVCGFKEVESKSCGNFISFASCYEKMVHITDRPDPSLLLQALAC